MLTDDNLSTLEDLKKAHALIVKQEQLISNIHLTVAYHRGLLYLHAREFVKKQVKLEDWYVVSSMSASQLFKDFCFWDAYKCLSTHVGLWPVLHPGHETSQSHSETYGTR